MRQSVAAGLCPHCLLQRALMPVATPKEAGAGEDEARWVGPYVLLEEIARGGMGIVFRARERNLGRVVALKLLRGAEWASGDALERFRTEARAAAGLVHPHIVPVYAFGDDGGNWYIAMRLVEGGSLVDWISRRAAQHDVMAPALRKLRTPEESDPNRQAALILKKVAEATHHAHQHGVLHRDLKPENVLLDASGEPFLTDFGLARLVDADARLTRTHASLGTPAYVAPEVARGGSSEATVQSDVYGLGAILYELLTGRPPFEGATPLEVLRRVADTEVRRPSNVFRQVDRDLETICLKAIAKEPAGRYPSAAALAEDLGRWLAGQPIEARPVGTLERTAKWVRRRPVLAALASLLTLSLLVITLGSWQVSRNLRAIGEQQRRSLVALNVDTANRLISQRDHAASLPYQIGSVQLEAADPARVAMHRIRLGLSLQAMPRLNRLGQHAAAANSVAFSHDGQRVLSAGEDGTARIWHVAGGGAEPVLKHPGPVIQALFSPDNRHILTLCRDGQARCWDAMAGTQRFAAWPVRLAYYKLPLSPTASFSPDGTRMLSVNGSEVEVRDTATGKLVYPALKLNAVVEHAAFSPDGERIVASQVGGLVQVWQLTPGGLQLQGSHRHPGGVTAASFSTSGRTVASVGLDAIGLLWDARTGAAVGKPFRHDTDQRTTQATFSPVDERFLTVSFDNTARVWDGASGQLLTWGIGHPNGVTMARWDPAGQRIVTGSFDGTARIWDAVTGATTQPLLRHGRYVVDAVFSPSGKELVTAAQDGGIRLWVLGRRQGITERDTNDAVTLSFFNPEGNRLAVCSSQGIVRVRGLLPGTTTNVTELRHGRAVTLGAFDPTGKFIATVTEDGAVHLWDAASAQETAPARPVQGKVSILRFDAAGERLLTISAVGFSDRSLLNVWSTPTLNPLVQLVRSGERMNQGEFSPDGRRILTTSNEGAIRFWDPATGLETGPAVPGIHQVDEVRFSPDGRWFVAAEYDPSFFSRPAQLWSVSAGQKVGPPLAHQDGTVSCAFSRDGSVVATGGEDGTARIWRVPTGEPLTPMMTHENKVRQVLFSADGTLLATRTQNGAVRLWDAATGSPVMESCKMPGGMVSMTFLNQTAEFLAVGSDGIVHRWDISPARESLEELSRMSDQLNGVAAESGRP